MDNAKDLGVLIEDDLVSDWPAYLDYVDEHGPTGKLQFCFGFSCPDYYDPVNLLEPFFSTNETQNWNGLQNETIDANLATLHTLSGAEKQVAVDKVVSQIIVEQAHALYFCQSADLFAWNSDVITDEIEAFFNIRGDKYFYPIQYDAPTLVDKRFSITEKIIYVFCFIIDLLIMIGDAWVIIDKYNHFLIKNNRVKDGR